MELTSITKEIYDSAHRLEKGSKQLFTLAKEWAEAEREYRMALQKQIVELKDSGQSVTLIPDIARGKTADLKFKRDLAEARYRSGRDSIEAIRSQMNGLQTIVKYQSEV